MPTPHSRSAAYSSREGGRYFRNGPLAVRDTTELFEETNEEREEAAHAQLQRHHVSSPLGSTSRALSPVSRSPMGTSRGGETGSCYAASYCHILVADEVQRYFCRERIQFCICVSPI
jgi:hypothetical protein